MKKVLFLMALAVAQTVGAQQLANGTFDAAWVDCYPWEKGSKVSTAVGTQPEGWCVSNVYNSIITMPALGTQETGADGTGKSVKLKNAALAGQNIPAYITLGTTWATAETQMTTVKPGSEDGGVFGGIAFTYHPDAVRLTYKCDRSAGAENISIIAYLWKGTWTQKDVPSNTATGFFSYGTATKVTMTDRIHNILGKETATGGAVSHTDGAALIASVEYYSSAAQSTWKTEDFPLDYGAFAGQPVAVEKFNIVVSANGLFDSRDAIKENNSLTFDDVVLVYWHALSALSYEGETIAFNEETTNYDLSSVVYDEAKLSYSIKGQAATATKNYNAETGLLTIRVEGEDIASNPSSYTEYNIQFKEPDPAPQVVSSKVYSEDLYVTEGSVTGDKQVADVVVETLDNGNINFVLKNFVLETGGSVMPVGNIAISNLSVAADGSFTFNDPIEITAGDDPAYSMWYGPFLTGVTLDLNGRFISEDHVVVYISIDLTEYMVYVHLGYARSSMAVNSEAKYGTFCAPYAVEVPDGVQAFTVPSVADNNVLDLTEVVGTIPANTPVVLFAEAGLETVESFGVAEAGTPVAGLLTGVYEATPAPVGSYVLQNQGGKVGFYHVEGTQPEVGANRCYLTTSSGIKAFFFDEDDATAIKAIDNAQQTAEGAIYNLSGQRMSKMQKGINIINGKKVLK